METEAATLAWGDFDAIRSFWAEERLITKSSPDIPTWYRKHRPRERKEESGEEREGATIPEGFFRSSEVTG